MAKDAREAARGLARLAADAEKKAADLEKAASFARAKADAAYTTGSCQPVAPVVCAPVVCPPVAAYCPPVYTPYTATNFGHHGCC